METFANTPFYKVEGTTPIVGSGGPLYTYTVYVQKGLGAHRAAVARRVDETLADKRSWIKGGKVRFQRVESGAGTDVLLAAPDEVDYLCRPLDTKGEVSCCIGRSVVLNAVRWRKAVPHWTGSVLTYRQMVINHEWGHRIGKGHGYCGGLDTPAPVMMQQTYGIGTCRCNSWPLPSEL